MAQATPMPMCPMAETCKGMMGKLLSSLAMVIPGIGDPRDRVHGPGRIDRRLAIRLAVAGGRRVRSGGRCNAPDGQFHARGRRPAQTRRRLARNNCTRAIFQSGGGWCAGT